MRPKLAIAASLLFILSALGLWVASLSGQPNISRQVEPPAQAESHDVAEAKGERLAVRPWPEAAEVRVFVEDTSYDEFKRTGKNMTNPDGIALTRVQRTILDKSVHLYRMTPKEYANYAVAGCFIPHHFFRYYDRKGRQIGELAVCYCCGGIEFSPTIRRIRADEEWQFEFEAVEKMLKEMGVPTDVNC